MQRTYPEKMSFNFDEDSLQAPFSPAGSSSCSSMSTCSDPSPSPLPSSWDRHSRSHSGSPDPEQQVNNRFNNIYEERLQPLEPSVSETRALPSRTHQPDVGGDPKIQSLMHLAVHNQDYVELQQILRTENVDINEFNSNGQTPLQVACLSGNFNLVKLIMSQGADPTLSSRDGFTTIHCATFAGSSEIFQYILLCSKR